MSITFICPLVCLFPLQMARPIVTRFSGITKVLIMKVFSEKEIVEKNDYLVDIEFCFNKSLIIFFFFCQSSGDVE